MDNPLDTRTPLLSVTVLNYNYAHYLPQCLDSILCQTWDDFELILINDCSTDNSLQVIEKYLEDPRIRLVNHTKNMGFVPSLIEGADLSRGKYMTVISADDFSTSPRAFARLLQPLEDDDRVAMSYSAFGCYSAGGAFLSLRQPYPQSYVRDGAEEFRELIFDPWILHSGLIMRRTAYRNLGGYDPSFRYAVDLAIGLLLCSQGRVAYRADQLFGYRLHQSNMSNSLASAGRNLEEVVVSFRMAFAHMRGAPGVSDALYKSAMKRYLKRLILNDQWNGRLRRAWYVYWRALRIHPLLVLLQMETLHLVAQTILGSRLFQTLRTLARRLSRRPLPVQPK